MYSTRLVHLLMVALSIVTVAQATWFNFDLIARDDDLVVRQDNNSTVSEDNKPTTASSPTSPEPTTTKGPETTQPTTKGPETTTPQVTKGPEPTTTNGNAGTPTTQQTSPTGQTTAAPGSVQTSSASQQGTTLKTTADGKTFDLATTTDSAGKPTTTAKPFTSIFTYTTTLSDGRTSAVETQSVVTPSLSQGQTGSGNEGMTKQTRDTIIGVTVGVGGAIVLAAAGVLIWRLRARRRDQEDGEDLVNYGAGTSQFNSGPEKNEPGSMSGRSPFQSTLESYHAPSQSNTGTNF